MRKLRILFLVIAMLSGTLCACTNNAASEDGKTGEDISDVKISTNFTQELTSDTLTDSSVKEENTSNAASAASSTPSKVNDSAVKKENPGSTASVASSTPSKVNDSAEKKGNTGSAASAASSTTSKVNDSTVKQGNTGSTASAASSTISKPTPPETTSSAVESNTYKKIDEVPPMVMEGEPVPITVSGETVAYDFNLKFSQAIVRSREELLSLYEKYDFESPYRNNTLFVNAKTKYGDDYFNENALILLYSRVGSSSKKHRFDCLVKKDAKLYAGVLRWIPGAKDGTASVTHDISAVCYVIEVKKSDIGGINDIELKIEYNPYIS